MTHIVERCEKRGGIGTSKKFPDLLIFDEKCLETLALQWIEAGMGFVISRSGVRVTPLAPSSRNNLDLLACRLRESECCGFFSSPKLTLFPIDRLKVFRPTGGTRTAVLMDLRSNRMIAPFLKAKRAPQSLRLRVRKSVQSADRRIKRI